eukprot:279697_1
MGATCSTCKRNNIRYDKSQSTDLKLKKTIEVSENTTRRKMKEYWKQHSQQKATNSLMLLMKEDEQFAFKEKQEIVSYLPNFDGLSVVELGAGVGRFTGDLAMKATTVLAVDFVEKFITENKERYGEMYPHIDYLCRDVTKLELDAQSYEFVFCNWLFMYLNDEELKVLADKFCKWCAYGGYIFFRESCFGGASGDIPRTDNPTFYRKHQLYLQIFDSKKELQRISVNQVQIYLDNKNKTNQFCFLYQKIKR